MDKIEKRDILWEELKRRNWDMPFDAVEELVDITEDYNERVSD